MVLKRVRNGLIRGKQMAALPFARRGGKLARQAGMTLLEIIIVVALIATLMSILMTTLTKTSDDAMRQEAVIAMGSLQQQLQIYRVHNHRYPTTAQGLDALLKDPGDARGWRGPYTEPRKINDPWGERFEYESDGSNFKITSKGPDGQLGNDDDLKYPEEAKEESAGG